MCPVKVRPVSVTTEPFWSESGTTYKRSTVLEDVF